MNIRLLAKLLGIISTLIGLFMVFSLPWAIPNVGRHTQHFERDGFIALTLSVGICLILGLSLYQYGRKATGQLFRKEAMAVVGLSWVLATILGALPFYLSGTLRGPSLVISEQTGQPLVLAQGTQFVRTWEHSEPTTIQELAILKALANAPRPSVGLTKTQLRLQSGVPNAVPILKGMNESPIWGDYVVVPREFESSVDRASNYRIAWTPMTICDALFESQSGFSTTGASVMAELEDSEVIAHCIHFWRSSTHFLGGLGIIVLFVILLGQGSAGKALMRTEVPGPASDTSSARMQHSAWRFAGIYVALNVILTLILLGLGMGPFDAICHAFGTMATGGFSTYNASLGHFQSPAIEYTVIVFMILAGTNFTLLYLCVLRQPGRLLADVEWRTYILIIALGTIAVILFCAWHGDPGFDRPETAFRNALFQVSSIITTTGYGTNDYDAWNQFARLLILLLMFVGGCAGSTSGGMKVIRHYLLYKILRIESEKAFHPRLVKSLKIQGDREIDEVELKRSLLVYVAMLLVLVVFSWLFLVAMESEMTWAENNEQQLIDSLSCVASMINNIGPGLGVVGPTENYGAFSGAAKLLFVLLMMLGRLEIWPILVLFLPRFWKNM